MNFKDKLRTAYNYVQDTLTSSLNLFRVLRRLSLYCLYAVHGITHTETKNAEDEEKNNINKTRRTAPQR